LLIDISPSFPLSKLNSLRVGLDNFPDQLKERDLSWRISTMKLLEMNIFIVLISEVELDLSLN
jgi:hypothetical protein